MPNYIYDSEADDLQKVSAAEELMPPEPENFYGAIIWGNDEDGARWVKPRHFDQLVDVEAFMAMYPFNNRCRCDDRKEYDKILRMVTMQEG